jgi:protocatechuate 3,4-dioxygenase beta subunit
MSEGELFARDLGRHPPAFTPGYRSSVARSPRLPLWSVRGSLSELTGPAFGHEDVEPGDADLLTNCARDGAPLGPRMILHGRVLDEGARPVPGTLVEVWQANAGGRYRHAKDGYLAPHRPELRGMRAGADRRRGPLRLSHRQPGPYPWPNGGNDWRPAHIHLSAFGTAFAQRLVTQIYFEGDPLIPLCPIVRTLPDPRAVEALVAVLDMEAAVPFDCLAYRFDVVLRGRRSTPFEDGREAADAAPPPAPGAARRRRPAPTSTSGWRPRARASRPMAASSASRSRAPGCPARGSASRGWCGTGRARPWRTR